MIQSGSDNHMSEDVELLLRIFSDCRPCGTVEAAYLFAETRSNQDSVCLAAADLLERGQIREVLISDCGPKSGYVGAAAYRTAMVEAGIPAAAIVEVPMEPTDILHTRIEAEAVVQFAKGKGYKRLIVTSVPFHHPRAFMTMVTVALCECPSLKLYSHPGVPRPWDEVVTHSQGVVTGTRASFITEELRRIATYTAGGDLARRTEILKYLRAGLECLLTCLRQMCILV